ncbi:specific peptidase [Seminavis robusta]|uniref:Specific peptidase n=1 Tax=Seminavis robusta TaxID=568900 RepID=A0A9N8HTL1_9STRA|nr:specific peptidase [Seminavis robusta]|eukprot:Sro1526_g279820.1 specific peptidase (594) ;mRNA; r:23349-25130
MDDHFLQTLSRNDIDDIDEDHDRMDDQLLNVMLGGDPLNLMVGGDQEETLEEPDHNETLEEEPVEGRDHNETLEEPVEGQDQRPMLLAMFADVATSVSHAKSIGLERPLNVESTGREWESLLNVANTELGPLLNQEAEHQPEVLLLPEHQPAFPRVHSQPPTTSVRAQHQPEVLQEHQPEPLLNQPTSVRAQEAEHQPEVLQEHQPEPLLNQLNVRAQESEHQQEVLQEHQPEHQPELPRVHSQPVGEAGRPDPDGDVDCMSVPDRDTGGEDRDTGGEDARSLADMEDAKKDAVVILVVESGSDDSDDGVDARKVPLYPLHPPSQLSDIDLKRVLAALKEACRTSQTPFAKIRTECITVRSFKTLDDRLYIDDAVLSGFQEIMFDGEDASACFRSQFFERCTSSYCDRLILNYGGVCNWAKSKSDLFQLDTLFFPANVSSAVADKLEDETDGKRKKEKNHWIAIVAFPKEKRIQVYDPLQEKEYVDHLLIVYGYLSHESAMRQDKALKFEEWTLTPGTESKWELPVTWEFEGSASVEAPKQTNGCDCGAFVLAFMYSLIRKEKPSFTPDDMTNYRRWVAQTIMKYKVPEGTRW